jgi:hypothetical protein
VWGYEKDDSTADFDGGNIVAREQGVACEIIPKPFVRNALRNGYETDAR